MNTNFVTAIAFLSVPLHIEQRWGSRPTEKTVKFGNTSDPAKRAAKLAAEISEWESGASAFNRGSQARVYAAAFATLTPSGAIRWNASKPENDTPVVFMRGELSAATYALATMSNTGPRFRSTKVIGIDQLFTGSPFVEVPERDVLDFAERCPSYDGGVKDAICAARPCQWPTNEFHPESELMANDEAVQAYLKGLSTAMILAYAALRT